MALSKIQSQQQSIDEYLDQTFNSWEDLGVEQ